MLALPLSCGIIAITSDGTGLLLDADTFEPRPLPLAKYVSAACICSLQDGVPRVILATKPSKKIIRLLVYQLPLGKPILPPSPVSKTDIADASAVTSMAAFSRPTTGPPGMANQISLLLCCGLKYRLLPSAASNTVLELLDIPPDFAYCPPLAVNVGHSKALLTMGPTGVIVDASGQPVGSTLAFGEDSSPPRAIAYGAADHIIVASEYLIKLYRVGGEEVQRISLIEAPLAIGPHVTISLTHTTSIGIVTDSCTVYVLQPVPLLDQAREALSHDDIELALEIIATAKARESANWVEEAYAQCALMYLHKQEFGRAMKTLENCTDPTVFHPLQLVPLFPECYHAVLEQVSSTGSSTGSSIDVNKMYWGFAPPLVPVTDSSKEEVARRAIIDYLFRVRVIHPGLELKGVDTFLVLLLIDNDAAEETAAFAAIPNQADVDVVGPKLDEKGWNHAHAILLALHGKAEDALAIWQHTIETSSSTATGLAGSREQSEALEAAVQLLVHLKSPAVVVRHLAWLFEVDVRAALKVIDEAEAQISPESLLAVLPTGSQAKWRYLGHLIFDKEDKTPQLHTDFALELIVYSSNKKKGEVGDTLTHSKTISQQKIFDLAQRYQSCCSESRYLLLRHLEHSELYDASLLLEHLKDSSFYPEQVAIRARREEHDVAMRILALDLRDTSSAEAYARKYLPPERHQDLLALLLNPGEGHQPLWEDACWLITALGAQVNPLDLLSALPLKMPLNMAVHIVSPLLRDRIHRKRTGLLHKALLKARLSSLLADKASAMEGKVVIDDGKACQECHIRLGGKVFVLLPCRAGEESQAICFACHRQKSTGVVE